MTRIVSLVVVAAMMFAMMFVVACDARRDEGKSEVDPVARSRDVASPSVDCSVCPEKNGANSTSGNHAEQRQRRSDDVMKANEMFHLDVHRVYFSGDCAVGSDPLRRKDTGGLRVVLEGEIQYRGKDLLMSADAGGALVLQLTGERQLVTPVSRESRRQRSVGITPAVRGGHPWVSGETRTLVIESEPVNEAFCEVLPRNVELYVDLETQGVADGALTRRVSVLPLRFEEVLGMAVSGQVTLDTRGGAEPARAHFSRREQVLVTRLDGVSEWVDRRRVRSSEGFARSEPTAFPAELMSGGWRIRIVNVSSRRNFGEMSLPGEDQFVVIVKMEMINVSQIGGRPGRIRVQMETSPGKWVSPLDAELGAISDDKTMEVGEQLEGVLLFSRTRFERPFRVRIQVPDHAPLSLDVFSYDVGPERSPL